MVFGKVLEGRQSGVSACDSVDAVGALDIRRRSLLTRQTGELRSPNLKILQAFPDQRAGRRFKRAGEQIVVEVQHGRLL